MPPTTGRAREARARRNPCESASRTARRKRIAPRRCAPTERASPRWAPRVRPRPCRAPPRGRARGGRWKRAAPRRAPAAPGRARRRAGRHDQWRRAAYSVALKIAEGAGRRGVKDFRKHLDIARTSLSEIEAILDLAVALGYLQLQDLTQVEATREECAKTVYGLLRKLPEGPKQPGR